MDVPIDAFTYALQSPQNRHLGTNSDQSHSHLIEYLVELKHSSPQKQSRAPALGAEKQRRQLHFSSVFLLAQRIGGGGGEECGECGG